MKTGTAAPRRIHVFVLCHSVSHTQRGAAEPMVHGISLARLSHQRVIRPDAGRVSEIERILLGCGVEKLVIAYTVQSTVRSAVL